MSPHLDFVVFVLDGQRYAVPIERADRFVRAVDVTPLPGAPAIALGAIDVGGTVVPVLSLRRRFALPDRDVDLSDVFLIARTASRTVALVVDEAHGVITVARAYISGAATVVPGLEHVHGIVRLDDGLVLIHDIDACLSLDEERAMASAVGQGVTDA